MFKKKFIIIFIFVLTIISTVWIKKVNAIVTPESTTCANCGAKAIKGKTETTQSSTCHISGKIKVYYFCYQTKCMATTVLTYETGTHQPIYENDTGSCDDTCVVCKEKRYSTHNYKYQKTTPATCKSKGYDSYKCSRCNKTDKRNYTDKLNHDYSYTTVAPTCTKNGYIIMKCKNCEAESIQSYQNAASALGHDFKYVIEQYATCSTPGSKTQYCQRDGCNAKGETKSIPATGAHNYQSTVIEPTCQSKGYTTYTCSYCGKTYNDNYTDIVDHSYEFIREQELTCIWNHFKYYKCKWCNKEKWENIELTTGHKWEGTECSVCGEKAPIIAGPWDISGDDNTSSVEAAIYDASSRRRN